MISWLRSYQLQLTFENDENNFLHTIIEVLVRDCELLAQCDWLLIYYRIFSPFSKMSLSFVTNTTWLSVPCSACDNKSAATKAGLAVVSAITQAKGLPRHDGAQARRMSLVGRRKWRGGSPLLHFLPGRHPQVPRLGSLRHYRPFPTQQRQEHFLT